MSQERRHFGLLPLIKPTGPTSHDMVDLVRRMVPRKTKVGHTGTLDPFASGVMILALGKATKFADEVHKLTKRYRAQIRLGQCTDTLDPTGEVIEEKPVPAFNDDDLAALATRFTGQQMQVPPAFSAKRVGGKKSYELARKNQAVPLPPSKVTLFDLQITKVNDTTLDVDVLCSTGTYVRALARDFAEALGTCGYVESLVRTAVGSIELAQCVAAEDLTADNLTDHAIAVSQLLAKFPDVVLPYTALAYLSQGRPFPTRETLPATFIGVIKDHADEVLAMFRCEYDDMLRAVQSRQLCYRRPDQRVPQQAGHST